MRATPATLPAVDVAVVGAGPAGSATAALLAAQGLSVALLDRAAFPRPKPCAEYLSPEATRILDRLGVTPRLEAEGAVALEGMLLAAPGGARAVGRFAGVPGVAGYATRGLAVRREVLDTRLVEIAGGRGAHLYERATVDGLVPAGPRQRTLAVRFPTGTRTLSARLVVGADGLNSRVARALGVRRRGRPRRLALVAHVAGVGGMGSVGEMHVGPGGYVGLAPLGGGVTNVAAVTATPRTGRRGAPPASRFHEFVRAFPALRARFAGARVITPVRAVGPFAVWSRRATGDRAVLAGDAADFYDPFTGEGIYAALRGAELVADVAAGALATDRVSGQDLRPYDRARRRAFGGKWVLERLVSWVVARPAAFDRVTTRLAARPHLADLLVGVCGNVAPPRVVLRPSFALELLR